MEKRLMMALACLLLSLGTVLAQNQIKGSVISSEDSLPVVGATIKVVGTNNGTLTDANGQFSLSIKNGAALEVSYVGMTTKKVNASPNMRITLDADGQMLDEVMVVAFGTAKKSAFTGSAKVVGAEELSLSQVTSVTNALAGAVSGVQLTSSSGDPSSSSTIRIRGFSSLNAGKDPLIIVDGAPYSGDIGNINPSDVESMTVLKDAASSALYGARGANGVIIITTKKAKSGDATITFDAKYGWNSRALQHYETIEDPAAYYEMHYDALKNYYMGRGYSAIQAWQTANSVITGQSAAGLGTNIWTLPEGQVLIGQNGKLNPNATLGRLINYKGEDYWVTPDDWEDVGTRTGIRQEYNVSIAGSTDKSNFYLSAGYLSNEGITDASDMQRFSARLKADYQVKKWLKVGANMSYARFEHNSLSNNGTSTSTGNIWAFTSQMAPIYPAYIRNGDGSIKVDNDGIGMMDYGDGTNAGQTRPFIYNANPILDSRLNTQNSEGNAATGSAFADFTIMPGLTLTINGTYNLDETRSTLVYNPYYGQFKSESGLVEKEHSRTYDWNAQQLLNYNTTIADVHNLSVMLGHEYYDLRTYILGAAKRNMFSQDNKELDGAVVDKQSAYSYKTRYNNEGYFGRAQYDYDTKYFASASLRRDASSRFHPDHRWGTFWSLGASWLINKESFFNVDWVNELKVKASYGSQGNDNISNYLYTDVFDIVNSGGNIGTSFASKGTEDITWETNNNFNAGVEFQLFNKLSGSIEYYYRKTTDMLYSFSVAPSLGYSSYYDNIGDLYNTGVEMELNYNAIRTKNIDWDVRFNIASLKNRISKLHDDKKTSVVYGTDGKTWEGYNNGNFYYSEDLSMYSWYMKDYAGVDAETGKPLWYKNVYETTTNAAGKEEDVWYDRNGNVLESADDDPFARRKLLSRETTDVYADADYYVINETTVPKFYGGFGTTVKAYGFDFSINCSFQIGGKQYDGTYAQFMAPPTSSNSGYKFHKDVLNSWTAENTSSSTPRWQYDDLYSSSMSTRFLTNASYLNIENINLGYTFPKAWTDKADITALRLYISAENVAYFSKRKGFDPRQSYSATTNASYYSPMRTISGGITVTF